MISVSFLHFRRFHLPNLLKGHLFVEEQYTKSYQMVYSTIS